MRTVTSAQPSLPVSSLEVALQGGARRQEILAGRDPLMCANASERWDKQRGQIYIGHIISLPNFHDKEKLGFGSKTVGSPNIHFEQVRACDASSRTSLSAS
jgi:hypothetical protein